MPNWIPHRVSLAGPPEDIAEFRATCLRPQRYEKTNLRQFDFEALVPMPSEIEETLWDETDVTKQAAAQATGYDDWYEWSLDHWGVRQNASDFRPLLSCAGYEEFYFHTPWSYPEPIFEALAQHFPRLAGVIFGLDMSCHSGFVGSINAGRFSGLDTDASPKLVALTSTFIGARPQRSAQAPQLFDDPPLPVTCGEDAVRLVNTAWCRLRSTLPAEQAGYTDFMTDLLGYRRWKLSGASEELLDQFVPDVRNRSFLTSDGRFRTATDQSLMSSLYDNLCVWNVDFDNQSAEDDWRRSVAYIVAHQTEDELREWIFDATFRGVRPDRTDDLGALRQCLTQYAILLRRQVFEHIQGTPLI